MRLEQTALQAIFNEQEYRDFQGVFLETCKKNPSIVGVMAIGSLVQDMRVPDPNIAESKNTPRAEVYEVIRNRGRRRIFPSANSDLDLWVCTSNPEDALRIEEIIELREGFI